MIQTSHHEENAWGAELANQDEAKALRAWRHRELCRSLRRNADVGTAPSQHWVMRLLRKLWSWL